MESELRAHLLTTGQAYAGAAGLELSTVGKNCAADGRFFDRLREGAGFTARKYDEVMVWFSTRWPEGSAWPSDVPRPEVETAPADSQSQAVSA